MLATYTIEPCGPCADGFGQTVEPLELVCYVDGRRVDCYRRLDPAELEDIAADFLAEWETED